MLTLLSNNRKRVNCFIQLRAEQLIIMRFVIGLKKRRLISVTTNRFLATIETITYFYLLIAQKSKAKKNM